MQADGLIQKLLNQRRVAWVGCVRHTAMNSNVVRPAERRCVGESEGCATMLKRRDVVDLQDARLAAPFSLTAPTIPI